MSTMTKISTLYSKSKNRLIEFYVHGWAIFANASNITDVV